MEYDIKLKSFRNTEIASTVCLPDNVSGFPLVLFAHGFCSNRHEDGAFAKLAERLMDNGIGSIRIDFAGCNDSKESYLKNTIDNDVLDLKTAYDYMKNNYSIKNVAVVGYSLGGKVAVSYIHKYLNTDVLVLFAPAITNGLDWRDSSLELGRADEMLKAYELAKEEGYYKYHNTFDNSTVLLSEDFIEQCLKYKTYDTFNEFKIPCLMIYGDKDDIIPLSVYEDFILNKRNRLFETHLIKDANHGFGMWDDKKEQFNELIDSAFKFIAERL